MGGVVVMRGGGPGSTPFEGDAVAWHAEDGAVVVTSAREIPGFALYVKDGRVVQELTFEEEAPDLEQLRAELATLMDRSRLARHLLDAKLVPVRDPAAGTVTFRGKLDRDVVRPMKERMMSKRVLGAEAEVVLAADGTLKEAKVKVLHSDPMQRMLKGEFKAVQIQVGAAGGMQPVPDEEEGDEKHDVETGSTTYTLTFDGRGPPERALAFKKKVEAHDPQ
jgi:hypothetical protein